MPENFDANEPRDLLLNWRILAQGNRLPDPEMPNDPVQSSTDNVHVYDLCNRAEQEAIRYGSRDYGINLLWGDPAAGDNIRFERQEGASGPLKSGELIAIHVKGGKFLKYGKRDYGINLGWSDTPAFEWKLVLPEESQPVLTVTAIGLYNTVEKDVLFYDPRTYGINLKWIQDKGKHNAGWLESVWNGIVNRVENVTVKDVFGWLV